MNVIAYDDTVCPRDASCPISKFTDASVDAWYHDGVHWALENSVMNGVGNDMFNPNGDTSRAMVVTMLYRYAQYKGQGFTGAWAFPLSYPDAASVSDWAYEPMCWMTMHGVINGVSGNLAPAANASRAQVATVFMRYCTETAK